MRPIIVTASEGEEFLAIRQITWPRLNAYAERHHMGFLSGDMTAAVKRPSSWKKLVVIAAGLCHSDTVIWVDADVYIANLAADIMAGVPADAWQAMVRHKTNSGDVPNCGVWIVRRPMLPYLMVAAMQDSLVEHPWWEQCAINSLMGFAIRDNASAHVSDTKLFTNTHWLDESFNVCKYTPPNVRQNWLHACGYTDGRLGMIEGWDRAANA